MHINYIPHNIDADNITVIVDNKQHVIPCSALNFNEVKSALMNEDYDVIPGLLDTKRMLETVSEGSVSCDGESVTYKDEPVHNSAATKLLNLMADGYTSIKPWLKFIDKLMRNPSHNSREQSYKFLEHKNMPLTSNGNILGYKGVRNDYKDKWSGKFDNSVGAENSMERSNVDDNINNGCSYGFHIGSHDYADSWGGSDGKLMLVEFSPEDIVSVPHDCNYAKLRVSKYKVVSECFDRKPVSDSGVYGTETNRYGMTKNQMSRRIANEVSKDPSFKNLQRTFPGIKVNEITAIIAEDQGEEPSFEFDNESGDLLINLPEATDNDNDWDWEPEPILPSNYN
jgi:hypothetical protein